LDNGIVDVASSPTESQVYWWTWGIGGGYGSWFTDSL